MKKSDLNMLVFLWVAAILLALVTAWYFLHGMYDVAGKTPTVDTPTTNWIQSPATDIAKAVQRNWAFTVAIIFPFFFGPLLVLGYAMYRFSKKRNPRAADFHDNVPLEVTWTVIPAIVLIVMAIPAYGVLRKMEYPPDDPDVIVDVIGHQFYWQYDFPRYDVTVTDDGTGDSPLYLPVDSVIYLTGTSPQVIHAWWVPAFGVKFDVIPGRINFGWFTTQYEGFFKGQCAELCGALHAFMFIHVKVVSEQEFFQWLHENDGSFPVEDREKVRRHLGEEVEQELFGDLPLD
jgi:cytochrome c oxidase subunit II